MVEQRPEPFFNYNYLHGGVFVNNTTENISLTENKYKKGLSVFDRGDQADSIPFYRGQFMEECLLIEVF